MTRELTPNRWNWDDSKGRWVFIELTPEGNKNFYYRIEPPREFIEITLKIKQLNDKLVLTKDTEENEKIFNQMMKIAKRLQNMRREL